MSEATVNSTELHSIVEMSKIIETARAAYIDNLQTDITMHLQAAYTELLSVNGKLLQELEQGSKELSVYRRLLYALQTQQLTKGAYDEIVAELQACANTRLVTAQVPIPV